MTTLPITRQLRIPIVEHGRRTRTSGVVIHVMDGYLSGTLGWFGLGGSKGAGAHLCVGKRECRQTADLDAVCWHAPGDDVNIPGVQNGNHEWVGIEHEGFGNDSRLRWKLRRTQRILSANRAAWILYHYRLGAPQWNKNLALHSDFPAGQHACPGAGFPKDLYLKACQRAYRNLVRSRGRTWNRVLPLKRTK